MTLRASRIVVFRAVLRQMKAMDLQVLPLHRYPKYTMECCSLINAEWQRSDTARLRSLESSCDNLPTCMILLKSDKVVGHCKLSPIHSMKDSCFVETVVIDRNLRGKGYGKFLMIEAERYCSRLGLKNMILSTKGQEGFYEKLGYRECAPITLYGYSMDFSSLPNFRQAVSGNDNNVPVPPPLPAVQSSNNFNRRIYMNKYIF